MRRIQAFAAQVGVIIAVGTLIIVNLALIWTSARRMEDIARGRRILRELDWRR